MYRFFALALLAPALNKYLIINVPLVPIDAAGIAPTIVATVCNPDTPVWAHPAGFTSML
jgi:hypothetical protein